MADKFKPVQFVWEGEDLTFRPLGVHAAAAAAAQYRTGHRYVLVPHLERSGKSHRHFFIAIKEGFENLPERWAMLFKSSEALRKYLLIQAGWCDIENFPCDTVEEAKRWMKRLKPLDEYGIVRAEGTVVTRYTAKSMSEENMDAEEFQRVKDRVLNELAMMLGVTKAELTKHAKGAM